ncbi:MAG: hypothetical protein JNM94_04560 [Phycisphaerae bacterium]|nr:hypothetical protein [Phycisphaerae bacterium]
MNPHERQYVDSLLGVAAERLVERLVHRAGSAIDARRRLSEPGGPDALGVPAFVDLFFADSLLDNPAGACVVLQAFADAPMPPVAGATIGPALVAASKAAFLEVLAVKVEEALDVAALYEGEVSR